MSNRYSKTGFTARQNKTLDSMRHDIWRILRDRNNKQDSSKSLDLLLRAEKYISMAQAESKEWKK